MGRARRLVEQQIARAESVNVHLCIGEVHCLDVIEPETVPTDIGSPYVTSVLRSGVVLAIAAYRAEPSAISPNGTVFTTTSPSSSASPRRDLAFEPFDVGAMISSGGPMLHVVVDKFLVAVQR